MRRTTERWRLAGWLGGVSPLRFTSECMESCQTGGETPPSQPARRQRSVVLSRPLDHNIRQPRSPALAVDDLHLHISPSRHAARALLREGDREAGVVDARVPGEPGLHVDTAGRRGVKALRTVVQQDVYVGDAVRRESPAADGERTVDDVFAVGRVDDAEGT